MRLLVLFASLLSVFGHSVGIDTCMNAPNHGSWGTGTPFNLQLLSGNQTVTSYTPHTNYSLVLSGNSAFRGYITTSGVGTDFVSASSNALGVWHLDKTDANVRMMTSCAGITQVSGTTKRQAKALWTAPASGLVTFNSIITVSQNGNNYRASLTVPLSVQTSSVTVSTIPSIMSRSSLSMTATGIPSITTSSTVSASEWKSSSATRSVTMSISLSGSVGTSSTSSPSESSTISLSNTVTSSPSITTSPTNSPHVTTTETPDGTSTQTPATTPSSNMTNVPQPGIYAPDVPQQPTDHSAAIGVSSVFVTLAVVGLAGVGIGYYNKKNKRKSISSRNVIDYVKPSEITANPLKTETKLEEFRTIV